MMQRTPRRKPGKPRRPTIKIRRPGEPEMVSSKLAGLTVLRKIIQKNRIQAKVLPYIVIRKPESFSMKLLPPGTKRVLVRTDWGGKKGVLSNEVWGDLPRRIFNASDLNVEQNISEFLQLGHQRFRKELFFIIHPLRPREEYANVGNIEFNEGHGLRIHFSNAPIGEFFRGTRPNMPARKIILDNSHQVDPSAALKKQLEKIAAALHKLRAPAFEASFVTYKSEPNVPEFYDFLVTT